MHLLTNQRPVSTGSGSLQPGTWLVEDADAAQIMIYAGGGECQLAAWRNEDYQIDGATSARRILVIRPGRFGDLVLLTPVLRQLKVRFPKAIIAVATLPQYRDALIGLPYIDEFVSYPVDWYEDTNYNSVVLPLEVLTSLGEKETSTHITDIFADRVGVELTDKKPDFFLSMDERDWAFNNYPSSQKKRVAIQLMASTPSRDYPRELWVDVIRRLHGRNWDVVILGSPDQIKFKGADLPGVRNCTADKLTFRQSAAVLSTANVFLGPDSALIHVAGALGTPALGLFASVPWQLRTKYCPTTFVIQSHESCGIAPCFHAPRTPAGFPINGPCAKTNRCEALGSITPDRVVGKLESMV